MTSYNHNPNYSQATSFFARFTHLLYLYLLIGFLIGLNLTSHHIESLSSPFLTATFWFGLLNCPVKEIADSGSFVPLWGFQGYRMVFYVPETRLFWHSGTKLPCTPANSWAVGQFPSISCEAFLWRPRYFPGLRNISRACGRSPPLTLQPRLLRLRFCWLCPLPHLLVCNHLPHFLPNLKRPVEEIR